MLDHNLSGPESREQRARELLFRGGFVYILLFAGLFALYLIISPHVALGGSPGSPVSIAVPYEGDPAVRLGMAVSLAILGAAALALLVCRRMTAGRALLLLVLGGIVLRFGVMLYTPFYIHGHDVGTYGGHGHLDYIVRLYETGRLPDTNAGQLYHPPLAHLAAAAAARLFAAVTGEADRDVIFQAARLAPCFFSCGAMLVSLRLMKALNLSGRALVYAMAVTAFHPAFFLLSSSINNDMAMVFFFLTAVLYAVRWYRDPDYKNILLLAASIGAAMSAKFSGAAAAVFTAPVFLLVLCRQYRDTGALQARGPGLVGRFAAFAAVCFPLGLWHPVRNLALFGQPPGYVLEIPESSGLYVGGASFAERFLAFNPVNVLRGGYCSPWEDVRLLEYTVKCALFGEFTFAERLGPVNIVLTAASLILIALSLFAMVLFVLRGRNNRLAAFSMAAVWLIQTASFVYFNIRYPFGCTMDFRYIVPTVVTGAVFLGLLFDRAAAVRRYRPPAAAMAAVLWVFALSAAAFYIA